MTFMKNILIAIITLSVLSACDSETIKRDDLAPNVAKKFDLEGHLTPKDTPSDIQNSGSPMAPIPNHITSLAINIDPSKQKQKKLFSVSAINVPIADLLFSLSVDSKKELDLDSSVAGLVTINAINQPLDAILTRVSSQVGAIYELKDGVIRVKEDKPYWRTYRLNYVNVSKQVKDETVMKMAVGSVGVGGSTSRAESSEFKMVVESNHDFWNTVLDNVKEMAYLANFGASSLVAKSQDSSQDTLTKKLPNSSGEAGSSSSSSSESKQVVINREAGLISVITSHQKQAYIQAYLDQISERTTKQVLIEATVVEVELNDRYQAGVDWSAVSSSGTGSSSITQGMLGANLSQDPAFSINLSSLGTFNFNVGIKMLQQFGDAKVLSSPKIMAMNNQSALLKVVDNEVYFTVNVNRESATTGSAAFTTFDSIVHTVPVGFMMNMTPFISDDDKISINIRPILSRIVGYVNDPNPELSREGIVSRIPVIQEREMDSILQLRDRQTAILGGLIQDKHSDQKTSVPFLGSIPWIGDLFSFRDDTVKKSELIIFIRPIIVRNPDIDNGDLMHIKSLLKSKTN